MDASPDPRYVLGAFCRTIRPFMSGVARTKKGFMKDFFDAVMDADYDDDYLRMNATLSKAADFALNGSVIVKFPSMVRATHKKGMCHMLVNDDRLHWVVCRDD